MRALGVALVLGLASTSFAQESAETPGVTVVNDEQGSRLLVDGKPFMVRGVNWDATPVGENYAWSFWDHSDDEIRRFLDRDMAMLKAAHFNAIRSYAPMPAKWIRYIYEKFGIYTVLNPIIGRYGLTIDGVWKPNTDYSDPKVRAFLRSELEAIVNDTKDTPGLLFWLLGNENNYGLFWSSAEIENLPLERQQDARAEALYSLVGELSDAVKAKDPHHPVAFANGDLQFIDLIAKHCPHLDIMGANVYRGRSARDLFDVVKQKLGRPFVFTEFGADAWNAREQKEDELMQASYLRDQWQEIDANVSGLGKAGNAIGGFVFQWADGWWKYQQDANLEVHDTTASWANAGYEDFVDGQNNMNEEWWGIVARAPTPPGELPPLHPRAAYFLLSDGFRFDPYAANVTPEAVVANWQALDLRSEARAAAADRAVGFDFITSRVRVSEATLELSTFTTGGSKLLDPNRNLTRFDHTESAFIGVEVTPTSNVKGNVIVNVLGNVATNPIDEIYFEKRGPNTVKIYQGEFEWKDSWFDLNAFYRVGHYHWGYEGDFFALYPEANYQRSVDMFNADTPSGFVVTGHHALEGLKIAAGPELYWGANPSVIGKYDRTVGAFEFSVLHQQDVAQRASAGTSSALPLPQTAKTTLYGAWKSGGLKFEVGGIAAGYDRVGRSFTYVTSAGTGASYLGSGYRVLDDTIRWYDTLGTKAKLTYAGGRVQGYAQIGYRGLVADSNTDQTITLTGWRLKESGQGNHWHAIAGGTVSAGPLQIAPNVIYQRPLIGPNPSINDYFDSATGMYYGGVAPRNQLKDPFWVRSNREMLGAELLLVFDPTPATWFWQWNNPQKENAPFAASLDFSYRHQPTAMDSGLGVLATGQTFAFPNSVPAKDVWEVWGRFVINAGAMHAAGSVWAGTGQANGNDTRLVTRGGVEARIDISRLTVNAAVKIADWGPYDYYRDYNLTFPLQLNGDIAWTVDTPRWFFPNQTKLGVMGKFRTMDQYSPRIDPTLVVGTTRGTEWEVKSYVRVSL